jgi:hypothetical protein
MKRLSSVSIGHSSLKPSSFLADRLEAHLTLASFMAAPRDDLNEQTRRNQSTRDCFDDFATHRTHVMRLLLRAAADFRDPPSLILLGAGNCNDVDLRDLLIAYGQIHLVDWDADALSSGIARQNLIGDPRIAQHAQVDLSRGNWKPPTAEGATVVASLCLLSQLIDSAARQADEAQSDPLAAIDAVRRNHLRHLVELLPPSGVGLLIFDFASSQTAPKLASTSAAELPAEVARLLQSGNFFQGLHPGGLFQLLTTDPWLASRISCHNPSPPWNWKVGNRVYAVSALVMRRKLASTGMIDT